MIVRTAPFRLIGLTKVTFESAVVEFRKSWPVPMAQVFAAVAVPQVTEAPAPPRLTVNGELLAAKPPLLLAVHWTWPAPVPMARVKIPAISRVASVPAVPEKRRLLFADRLLIDPNVSAAFAATVAFALRRMCVGSRMAAIVVPPAMPVPVTVWPMTRP